MSSAPSTSRRDHPVFARFYERLATATEKGWEGDLRDEICGDLEGRVLEIGAGTGMNFGHYRRARVVIAFEPEPNMLRLATPRAQAASVPIRLVRAAGERLPFRDQAFDAVVCSLVLCTIQDPMAAIAEMRRVLRPDGVVRLYEHVRAERPRLARLQDLIERPWGFFAGGCHPNRDTVANLERGGFAVQARTYRPPFFGASFVPHVVGEARLGADA